MRPVWVVNELTSKHIRRSPSSPVKITSAPLAAASVAVEHLGPFPTIVEKVCISLAMEAMVESMGLASSAASFALS